jgi:hypothetical protein
MWFQQTYPYTKINEGFKEKIVFSHLYLIVRILLNVMSLFETYNLFLTQ